MKQTRTGHRALSLLLAVAMVLSMSFTTAFAEESTSDTEGLSDCHTAHDGDCGYSESTPCTHTCEQCATTDESTTDESTTNESTTDETVCICDPVLSADETGHGADCPLYVVPESSDTLQALLDKVDALPPADSISADNKEASTADLAAAMEAYEALADADKSTFDATEQHATLLAWRAALSELAPTAEEEPLPNAQSTVRDVADEAALFAAISDAEDGDTIQLTADFSNTETAEIQNKDISLDLNGYTLTYATSDDSPCFSIEEGAALTIVDSSANQSGTIFADMCAIDNYGTLTINGGTIVSAELAIYNDDTLEFKKGLILGDCIGAGTDGLAWSMIGNATLHMNARIPTGKILTVPSGATLTIAENVVLTIKGSVTNSGTIQNHGTIYGTVDGNQVSGNPPTEREVLTHEVANEAALRKAISDAETGDTIQLTADFSSTQAAEIRDKDISLDLNGYTLTYAVSDGSSCFMIAEGAALTIVDSSEKQSGTIVSDMYAIVNNGTVTINGGTIVGGEDAISNYDGTLTISGGTIVGGEDAIYNSGTLTINGGTIFADGTAISNDGGTLTINGGTIVSGETAIYNGGTVTFTKGLILGDCYGTEDGLAWSMKGDVTLGASAKIPADKSLTVPSGATLTIAEKVVLTIKGSVTNSGTIQNHGTIYGTVDGNQVSGNQPLPRPAITHEVANAAALRRAISDAEDGDTIQLTADFSSAQAAEIQDKDISLDLNGHTLTHATSDGLFCFMIAEGAALTIVDGSANQSGTIVSDSYAIVNNGTVTINGGTIVAARDAISNYSGTLTINGGTIVSTGTAIYNKLHDVKGTVTINGGTIVGGESAIYNEDGTVTFTKGLILGDCYGTEEGLAWSMKGDVTLHMNARIPTGKSLTVPAGATLTIAENVVLTIKGSVTNSGTIQNNGTIYGTVGGNQVSGNQPTERKVLTHEVANAAALRRAISDAEDGDTIQLTADFSSTQAAKIKDKDISLDLNGHTLTYTSDGPPCFSIEEGAALTIVDSSEKQSGTIVSEWYAIDNSGTLTINGGTIVGGEDAISNYDGTLTINGGTIVGGEDAISNYDGTLTINGGTIVGGEYALANDGGTVTFTKGLILGDCEGDDIDGLAWSMKGDVTLHMNARIPTGKSLTVPAGATLTIAEGITLEIVNELTNKGSLIVNGTLKNEGYFVNEGSVSGTGQYSGDGVIELAGVIQPPTTLAYTGEQKAITVGLLDKTFVEDTDYTVQYTGDRTNVGDFTATVALIDNDSALVNGESDPVERTFTILPSETAFTGGIQTDLAGNKQTVFTYGDRITVTVTPKASGTAANSKGRAAPQANEMALFVGETQLTEPQPASNGQTLTFTLNTADKMLPIGQNALIARYVGNSNMAGHEETLTITLNPKPLTATVKSSDPSASKGYDATTAFTGVALTLNMAGMTATADGTADTANAGTAKAFTASKTSLHGDEAMWYSLPNESVSGTVSITPKDLIVTANDCTIGQGDVKPLYTVKTDGLVGRETISGVSFTDTATDSNTAGSFVITPAGGTVSSGNGNYKITYATGTLTILDDGSSGDGGSSGGGGGGSSGGGGGSSGGGGGSSSGGSTSDSKVTITPPSQDKPKDPTQAEVKVDSKIDSKGNASMTISEKTMSDAIKKAKDAAKKSGNETNGIAITLKPNTDKTLQSLTTTIPKATQEKLIASGVTTLTIGGDASITIDLEALKQIKATAKAELTVTATKRESSTLSAEAQAATSGRSVWDFQVSSGDKTITTFGNGKLTLAIPYELQTVDENGKPSATGQLENPENLVGVYIDEAGKPNNLPDSKYDTASKTMRIHSNHLSIYGVAYQTSPANTPTFTDIAGHWAKDDIEFVAAKGLLTGTGEHQFSPDSSMTRGMFVTVLGRLAGIDSSKYQTSSFSDVAAGSYYLPYIEWASKNQITNGVGDGKFAPDQAVTRQEMAVFMSNYAKAMGYTLPITHKEITFTDSATISPWASAAVKEMQLAGILMGRDDGAFDPNGTATRAEGSAMIHRFVELLANT